MSTEEELAAECLQYVKKQSTGSGEGELSEDSLESVSGGSGPIYVCGRCGNSGSSAKGVKHTLWCASGTMGPDKRRE
jgi:hypothetical protein